MASEENRKLLNLNLKNSPKFKMSQLHFVAFGNPVLDMSKTLSSNAIHKKYNLKADDQLELDREAMEAIKKEIENLWAFPESDETYLWAITFFSICVCAGKVLYT